MRMQQELCLPHLDGLILARGGDKAPVGRPGHVAHHVGVATIGHCMRVCDIIPDLYRANACPVGDALAMGRPGHGSHGNGTIARVDPDVMTGRGIPRFHVVACSGQTLAVWGPCYRHDQLQITAMGVDMMAGSSMPDLHGTVDAARSNALPTG